MIGGMRRQKRRYGSLGKLLKRDLRAERVLDRQKRQAAIIERAERHRNERRKHQELMELRFELAAEDDAENAMTYRLQKQLLMDGASVVEFFSEQERKKFLENNNPLHAWAVISLHLSGGWHLPQWTLDYLKESAGELMQTADSNTKGEKRGSGTSSDRFARALGAFRPKRGCVFNEWTRTLIEQEARRQVNSKTISGEKTYRARECVAEDNAVPLSTLRGAITPKKPMA